MHPATRNGKSGWQGRHRGLVLRPYQEQCLLALGAAYRRGKRRVLVSLPTGTGKTVIFAQFPRYFQMKHRLLVLAHREELLEQAQQKFLLADAGVSVDIEQGRRHASPQAQVVVASVLTLGRKGSRRLLALDPDEFYLIVADEAHHAVASTYQRVFEHFRLYDEETPRMLIGFTATPYRGDRQRLGEVFEDIVYSRGLRQMVAAGYLARVRGWRIHTDVSLDEVKVRHGDFVESQLARAVDVAGRNEAVVKSYRDFAPGRRGIVFCVNVEHVKAMAETFRRHGVKARAVWGDMSKAERQATLAAFSSGEITVITNCNVLTEGFDEPQVGCVLMARPTRSKLLYAQMVGRGTRLHPEKEDLVVIDVADNSQRHSLVGLHNLFDLPASLELQGADVLRISQEVEELSRGYPWVDLARIEDPDDLQIAAQRIDLFNLDSPSEIRHHTGLAWHSTPSGDYCLALPEREQLLVRANLLDSWDLVFRHAKGLRLLCRAPHLEEAIQQGDRFVYRERREARRVVDRTASWRGLAPTDKQRAELRRLGIPTPGGLNRGQASWILGIAYSRAEPGEGPRR